MQIMFLVYSEMALKKIFFNIKFLVTDMNY